jgi:hypothetical protein
LQAGHCAAISYGMKIWPSGHYRAAELLRWWVDEGRHSLSTGIDNLQHHALRLRHTSPHQINQINIILKERGIHPKYEGQDQHHFHFKVLWGWLTTRCYQVISMEYFHLNRTNLKVKGPSTGSRPKDRNFLALL